MVAFGAVFGLKFPSNSNCDSYEYMHKNCLYKKLPIYGGYDTENY